MSDTKVFKVSVSGRLIKLEGKGMFNKHQAVFPIRQLAGVEKDGNQLVRVYFNCGASFFVTGNDNLTDKLNDPIG